MTKDEVMIELRAYGNEQTKKVLARHGAREPFFGVKVGDMKRIVKKIRKDHELSLQLYDTGNSDAMYLAGLIADESRITREQLDEWARKAYWYMLSDYAVAAVASESPFGMDLALDWIESDREFVASAGWSTLSNYISIREDSELDRERLSELLKRVESSIHRSPNRVRYSMNGFVIALGSFVEGFADAARKAGLNIGKVNVEMGRTACRVPYSPDYISKVESMGRAGQKRKIARC